MSTVTSQLHEEEILAQGFSVIEGITTDEEAESVLRQLGTLIPQYNGRLRYEVAADESHERRQLSKSTNSVPWHVDAPSWTPPPARMALHCRQQARCGGGHTDLADMRHFVDTLSPTDRSALYEIEVPWIDRNTGTGVSQPIVERRPDGREIIRWRQSLLVGRASERLLPAKAGAMPLGEFGVHLASLAEEFFAAHAVPVLVPEQAVLVWDNQRLVHQRRAYSDPGRRLTRYWMSDPGAAGS